MADADRLRDIRHKYRGLRGDMPPFGDVVALLRMLEAERSRWMDCARVDATMEGPKLRGWNRSALDRCWKESLDAR
jgi:hypothetical protein